MQEEAPARFPEPCRIGGIDMGQWGFWFDQQDCINCHTCEIACKVWNEQKRGDARLYPLRELTGGTAGENAVERNYYMTERLRRSWYEDRGNGLVKHLVVEDAARGKGVGTLLLKYAEDEMVSRGIRKCVLKARISVTGFYEKLGYHTVGDVMPDDVPHIMMEKCLDVV